MELQKERNCTDMLLDLLCYEIFTRRLSPEMEDMLNHHLDCCPACRRKVCGFRHILGKRMVQRNFG
jgi:hypothetical protein